MPEIVQTERRYLSTRDRGRMSGVQLHDRLVGIHALCFGLCLTCRHPTRKEIASGCFLHSASEDSQCGLTERHLAPRCLCLSVWVKEITRVKINVLTANPVNLFGSHAGFQHE